MNVRRPKSDRLCETGRQLINEKHPKSGDILSRVQSLQNQWQKLTDLATHRSKQLQDAAEAYQVRTFLVKIVYFRLKITNMKKIFACNIGPNTM